MADVIMGEAGLGKGLTAGDAKGARGGETRPLAEPWASLKLLELVGEAGRRRDIAGAPGFDTP